MTRHRYLTSTEGSVKLECNPNNCIGIRIDEIVILEIIGNKNLFHNIDLIFSEAFGIEFDHKYDQINKHFPRAENIRHGEYGHYTTCRLNLTQNGLGNSSYCIRITYSERN
jgi:hypothetical protein